MGCGVHPLLANPASWRALLGAGFERVWTGDVGDPEEPGDSVVCVLRRS